MIWSYTQARVLTLEYLEGVQLQDLEPDDYTVEERRRLAYLMTEAWMTMIFKHGMFHGDPHPANILVLDRERIGLVDFGLAGKLSDDDMTKLTRLFIDAASENVEMLPNGSPISASATTGAARTSSSPTSASSTTAITVRGSPRSTRWQLIREAFSAVYAMNLRLPTRFVMLDKTVATLGSVGIELYPDFNVFEVAQPYARDLMISRYTPRRVLADAQKEAFGLARVLREAPYQWHDLLEQLRDGQIEVGYVHKGLDEFMPRVEQGFNRLVIALVAAGGLIGSSLIGVFATGGPHVLGLHVIALVGFVLSGVLSVWLLWGVVRSGRL